MNTCLTVVSSVSVQTYGRNDARHHLLGYGPVGKHVPHGVGRRGADFAVHNTQGNERAGRSVAADGSSGLYGGVEPKKRFAAWA